MSESTRYKFQFPPGQEPELVPAVWTVKHTDRGFELCQFDDHNGRMCSLQQSSATTEENFDRPGASFVWLGREGERMHLSREQVLLLLTHLSAWLEHGSFMKPFEDEPEPCSDRVLDLAGEIQQLATDLMHVASGRLPERP